MPGIAEPVRAPRMRGTCKETGFAAKRPEAIGKRGVVCASVQTRRPVVSKRVHKPDTQAITMIPTLPTHLRCTVRGA